MARRFHRGTAILLGVFILSHLTVHMAALWGAEEHVAALRAIQWVYRNPFGETLLISAILVQATTGASRLRFAGASGASLAQAVSGAYLIFFFVVHTGAALYTRHFFGIETDFYWAAGSLQYDPIRWVFAFYYAAGIIALFVHWGAAFHFGWPTAPKILLWTVPSAGVALAAVIVPAFWVSSIQSTFLKM